MQAPKGRSGVQPTPNNLQSRGCLTPLRIAPHSHAGLSAACFVTIENGVRRQIRVASRRRSALKGILPNPRHSNDSRSSKISSISARALRLPSEDTARMYWFSTSARPSLTWRINIKIACKTSSGSNPAMTIDLWKSLAKRL